MSTPAPAVDMPEGRGHALWILLAGLAALPVLLPMSQPPIVTAAAEMAAVAAAGLVALALGARAWRSSPVRVAAFSGPTAAASLWPPVLLGAAALAGLISALIAVMQVLAPDLLQGPLGSWIEPSHLKGRAVGHVRQPNHLATVLLWGAIGWVVMTAHNPAGRISAALGLALLMWALVLTGSRTGLLGIGVLVVWGLWDRDLPRWWRLLLVSTPVQAALAWWFTDSWSHWLDLDFGASAHMAASASGDISSSRFAIWRNTLSLIGDHLWTGVGWGNFNIAWTLTPLPSRPTALFDHAHNLPLHLMAELGVPLGLLFSLMGGVLVVFATRSAFARPSLMAAAQAKVDTDRLGRRGAAVMLGIVGLHSLLEYPLWYAYFSLPTAAALAVAWGWDRPMPRAARWQALVLMVLGSGLMASAAWAYSDYQNIRAIYAPGPQAAPLATRMAKGQRNTWFVNHAHYAVATNTKAAPGLPWPTELEEAFEGAPRVLLDTRLMMAWARALAARNGPGDLDKARYLANRLREFNPVAAQAWWAGCEQPDPPAEVPRYPCEPAQTPLSWTDFIAR